MQYTEQDLLNEMDALRNTASERMSDKELNALTKFEKDDSDNGTIWTVLIYALAILSAVTASFFITHLFGLSDVSGWIIAAVILLGWEWLKNIFTGRTMREFIGKGRFNPIFAIVSLICVAGSIYSSFEGGRIGNQTINDPMPAIDAKYSEKLAAIKASYAEDIADYKKKIASQYNTTYANKITREAQAQIKILEPAIQKLKAEQKAEIRALKSEQDAEIGEALVSLNNESDLIGYVTILLEILLLIAHYQNTIRLHEEHLQIKAKRNLMKKGLTVMAPMVNVPQTAPAVAVAQQQVGVQMSTPNIKDPSTISDRVLRSRIKDYRERLNKHITNAENQLAQTNQVTKTTQRAMDNNAAILNAYENEAAKPHRNV